MKQTKILTHATHVNGWFPAVYMSYMSQNFRLFHVSNLSVRNFRIFLLMYPGSLTKCAACALCTGVTGPLTLLRQQRETDPRGCFAGICHILLHVFVYAVRAHPWFSRPEWLRYSVSPPRTTCCDGELEYGTVFVHIRCGYKHTIFLHVKFALVL